MHSSEFVVTLRDGREATVVTAVFLDHPGAAPQPPMTDDDRQRERDLANLIGGLTASAVAGGEVVACTLKHATPTPGSGRVVEAPHAPH